MSHSSRRIQVLQEHLAPSTNTTTTTSSSNDMTMMNNTSSPNNIESLNGPLACELSEERSQSRLSPAAIRALTHILSEGEDVTHIKEHAMQLIERDPILGQVDNYDKNLEQLRVISMQKVKQGNSFFESMEMEMDRFFQDHPMENNSASFIEERKEIAQRHVWNLLALSDPGSFTRLGVHTGLFLGAIKGQGHDELRKKIVPLAESLQIYGVFAMTELGHGSYLRGLETTATFDPIRDEFIIHSPTDTSTKWWIGGAGSSATHALVFAQLNVGDKNYGPHSFLVQLRDLRNHEAVMGVSFGDIGKKMGRDTIDNGWIQFTNVRIPRSNMLMKWAQLSRDGIYTPPPLPQLAYGAVIPARLDIVGQSSVDLQRALTIAIRYGCVRRQFHTTDAVTEQKIMDYQSHQYRLFPYLSAAFAMQISASKLNKVHSRALNSQEKGQVTSVLPDLHNLSAGLKAYTTWITLAGLESCRQACGGHGYSSYNGLSSQVCDFSVQCTWDGDNTVLAQQTSRYLLKSILAVSTGKVNPNISRTSVSYLTDLMSLLTGKCEAKSAQDFSDANIQLHAVRYKSAKLLSNTGLRAQKIIGNDRKKNMPIAWNECQVDLLACSKAHCYLYMAESFIEAVAENSADASVHRVLKNICDLFVCDLCLRQDAAILMAEGYMTSKQFKLLEQRVRELMKEIRQDAITIVDSFNISDFIINSPLGCYDGQVYKKYFDRVKKANPSGVVPPYYNTLIKDMINPNLKL